MRIIFIKSHSALAYTIHNDTHLIKYEEKNYITIRLKLQTIPPNQSTNNRNNMLGFIKENVLNSFTLQINVYILLVHL